MYIIVPDIIIRQKSKISTIHIRFRKMGTLLKRVTLDNQSIQHPNQKFILSVVDRYVTEADLITIDVLMVSGDAWSINFDTQTKSQLMWSRPVIPTIPPSNNVKHNFNTIFSNTSEDKQIIDRMQQQLHSKTLDAQTTSKGSKNLIYYVVGFNDTYLQLLTQSLKSIKELATIPFDVVVITDNLTKKKIQTIPELSKSIDDIFVVGKIDNGISCSMNKTVIFQYPLIDRYKKILFIDCDVICKRDIAEIFDLEINGDVLYTVSNPSINTGSFKTLFHGLLSYKDETLESMVNAKQLPFNAGQFLFMNTPRMAAHFAIVNWLIEVWPGAYFFEQSFMNHYFCTYHLTNPGVLSNRFDLLTSNEDITKISKLHRDDTVFVHFVAPALRGDIKLAFINAYRHANQF